MNEFTMFTINLLFIYGVSGALCFCSFPVRCSCMFEISTEKQTSARSHYNVLEQIRIFAVEISLSAICKITWSCFKSEIYHSRVWDGKLATPLTSVLALSVLYVCTAPPNLNLSIDNLAWNFYSSLISSER